MEDLTQVQVSNFQSFSSNLDGKLSWSEFLRLKIYSKGQSNYSKFILTQQLKYNRDKANSENELCDDDDCSKILDNYVRRKEITSFKNFRRA